MSSGIQFGDVEHSQPEPGLRPDQDAHFATAVVGSVPDHELLIFVDLDVMRDMEAHALSNTRVELGGVMLGRQLIDEEGRPFVVISDCLRAEHYEATKGSFKFTHETWSQITRQREEFRPDLEMVGWYHTHPGWSVFLSGMDLFICNNFFNRPLDVALVIDPCEQDRGWFQWTEDDKPRTFRTKGFVLTTSRFRQLELDQFARLYNKEPIMTLDPRYSGSLSGNGLAGTHSPVTLMDNRKPAYELAVIGMLSMQFLLVALLAWKMIGDPGEESQVAKLETQIEAISEDQNRSMREQAYQEMLETVVAGQTGQNGLVEKFAELRTDNEQLQANVEGQLALAKNLQADKAKAMRELQSAMSSNVLLERQLGEMKLELADANEQVKLLGGDEEPPGIYANGEFRLPWWWVLAGSLLVAIGGSALGFSLGRRDGEYEEIQNSGGSSVSKPEIRESEKVFETASEEPLTVVSREPVASESNVDSEN